jgi:hypothetical protein
MNEEFRELWMAFIDGRWTKDPPTEPGFYQVRFGTVITVQVYKSDAGALMAYHLRMGHRTVDDFFASRWRWSVAMPSLPEPPR